MISFLGTGLLGSNFARAAVRRGEAVTVWNRTLEKAQALEPLGVRVAKTPAEAVRGASRVHVVLSDDAAVDDTLAAVLDAGAVAKAGSTSSLSAGTPVIDHTTTSASGVRERAARFSALGVPFLHAPVFMGPQNALDGTGVMLASGPKERFEALRSALEPMTGKLVYLGPEPERAAGFKLMGNLFLMFMTAGLADMFGLAKALGISAEDASKLLEVFNPATTLAPRVARILRGEFERPSWELAMARKDARLMLEESVRGGAPLAVLPAIAGLMDAFLAQGHGKHDWTVIASAASARSPRE